MLKKRWVVELTMGKLMGCRRLVRDYELLPETSETFIYLAMNRNYGKAISLKKAAMLRAEGRRFRSDGDSNPD